MTARRATILRIARRSLGGLIALALLLVAAGAFVIHRADSILRQLLRDYASSTVATQSDSVYRLAVEGIHFNWALRHVSIDSVVLTTDTLRSLLIEPRKPAIKLGLYGCTFTGVSLRRIVLSQGLSVRRLGCGVVTVDVAMPPLTDSARAAPPRAPRPTPSHEPQPLKPFLVLQQELKLPASVPRVRVRFIDFPHASFVFTSPRRKGGSTRIALEHVEWHVRDLVIDNDDPAAATRPLFSKSVNLSADKFTFDPDSVTRVAVGSLRMSVTDSMLALGAIEFGPTVSDAQFARQRPWRRSRTRIKVDSLTADGIDFGKLMRRGGFFTRRLGVAGFDVDIWSDKRLPKNPNPRRRLSPQAWFHENPGGYGIDTVSITGKITYRERREGHDRDGVLTFNRLRATAVNVHHVVERHTFDDPMTLTATAYLMNDGRLDATFVVPLDAPSYTMRFSGKLGRMPAESLNGFVEQVFPAKIIGGVIDEIRFRANVRNGVATGELTPLYHGFGINVTGRGAGGILGNRGTLASVARGIASFFANEAKLRNSNPERPDRQPITGAIAHPWEPQETLPAFVWRSVRDPLLAILKK